MADVTDVTQHSIVVPQQRSVVRSPARQPAARRGRAVAATAAWAGAGVLVAVALTALGSHGLGDDSYISLDYARTLLEHGRWGLVPGRTANTATSPLNVWLLTGGLAVTGTVTGAVGAVLAVAFAAIGAGTHRLARSVAPGPVLPLGAMALLAASPLLASTLGLETYLGVAVIVGTAVAATAGRPGVAGALVGVAVLVRPDYLVPAVVVVLLLLRGAGLRSRLRGLLRAGAVAALVAAPWHVWAWYALGGFVPDTFSFKTNPAAGHVPAMIADFDALYWSRTPVAVVIVGVVVLAGWGIALALLAARDAGATHPRPGTVATAFAASGTAHLLALMSVNAYPQAWYYGPLVAGCALAAAVGAAVAPARLALPCLVAFCCAALVVAGHGGVPWRSADMNSNFTDAAAYLGIGHDLPRLVGSASVAPPGEIGALAWGCRCDLVDQFSARADARPLLDRRYDRGGRLSRALLALNWRHRPDAVPPAPGYRLRYVRGDDATPAGVLHTWWVTSPQNDLPFRIVLVPTG